MASERPRFRSDPGRLDGVLFYGVPVVIGSDLHEALREVEDEVNPRTPESLLLDDDPKYAPGTNPQLPLARRLRGSAQDVYEHIPGSVLYLGMSGDREQRLYFLSDSPIYVPNRHLIAVDFLRWKKGALEARARLMGTALSDLGLTAPSSDLGAINFYLGSVAW